MSSFCSFATTIKHIDECDRSHILFISLFLISYIRLLTEIRVKYLSKKVSPFNWTRNVFGEDPLYLLIYFRFSYLVCLWLILKWIWPEFDNFWLKIQLSVLNEIIIYWIILIHKIPILCKFLLSALLIQTEERWYCTNYPCWINLIDNNAHKLWIFLRGMQENCKVYISFISILAQFYYHCNKHFRGWWRKCKNYKTRKRCFKSV